MGQIKTVKVYVGIISIGSTLLTCKCAQRIRTAAL